MATSIRDLVRTLEDEAQISTGTARRAADAAGALGEPRNGTSNSPACAWLADALRGTPLLWRERQGNAAAVK